VSEEAPLYSSVGLLFRSGTFDSNLTLSIYINLSSEMHFINVRTLVTGSFPASRGSCPKLCCIPCVELSASLVYYDFPQSTDLSEQQNRSAYISWECNSAGLILLLGHRVLLPFLSWKFHFVLIKRAEDLQELEKGLSVRQLVW